MSSGLDVYLENSGAHKSISHNKPFPVNVNLEKQIEIETYFLRVNQRGLSWGKMKQIDDNILIRYDKTNSKILGIDLL
jgi:predicted 3-demethylubiquinone-9 3-methyltransferase (glyoxalase superfamily)